MILSQLQVMRADEMQFSGVEMLRMKESHIGVRLCE